jgi:hypothetical protein
LHGSEEEAALLEEKLAGIDAGIGTAVPTDRSFAKKLFEQGDRPMKMRAFFEAALRPLLGPAQTMSQEVMTRPPQPRSHFRIALQSVRASGEGRVNSISLQDSGNPPNPNSASIFEMRFSPEIADTGGGRQGIFAPTISATIPVEQGIFGSLLIANH